MLIGMFKMEAVKSTEAVWSNNKYNSGGELYKFVYLITLVNVVLADEICFGSINSRLKNNI